jgi:hypothetical protein
VKQLAFCTSLLLVLFTATLSFGQEHATAPQALSGGGTESGVIVAFGHAMDVWGGIPDNEFLDIGVRLGHVFAHPIGPGPLAGNFAITGELCPVILFREKSGTTYAFSAALILRHYFAPNARIRPFIDAGAGAVISSRPIPRDVSRVNFTPQGGGGVAMPLSQTAVLTVQYRIRHMSDWALTSYNPGANSNELQVGVSWIH